MHIAVLGTGHMGTTLAAGLTRAGHTVTLGSRRPDDHPGLPAQVTTHEAAIAGADVVVNAIDASASLAAMSSLRAALRGKVLIDIGNAVDETMDLRYQDGSLGERLQDALPDTDVVTTLNTVGGPIGVQPDLLPQPTTVFVSGEDDGAKKVVVGLLDDLGWGPDDVVDLGGIATARAAEHYFLLFAALMRSTGTPAFNISVVK